MQNRDLFIGLALVLSVVAVVGMFVTGGSGVGRVALSPGGTLPGMCAPSDCGGKSSFDECYCDELCVTYGDCCTDYADVCGGSSFNCGPLNSLASSDTGNEACAREGKECLVGTLYSRMMLNASDPMSIVPGHFIVMDCGDTMESRMSLDQVPTGASIDYDPDWVCCSAS